MSAVEILRTLIASYLIATLGSTALAKLKNRPVASAGMLTEMVIPAKVTPAVIVAVAIAEFSLRQPCRDPDRPTPRRARHDPAREPRHDLHRGMIRLRLSGSWALTRRPLTRLAAPAGELPWSCPSVLGGGPVRRITALVAAGAVALLTPACTAGPPPSAAAGKRPAASPPASHHPGAQRRGTASLTALLKRPLRFPVLRPGQPCPATHGTAISTAAFGGIALGSGPIRPIIAQEPPDVAHRGIAYLAPTSAPPWLGIKTLWFSAPAYQGPFVIRAKRLDHAGPVALGGTPAAARLAVPSGPAAGSPDGWRTVPGGTWVKSPGCYAWQVDGLTFSEEIVVKAVLR